MGVASSRPEYSFELYAELTPSQIDAIATMPEVATIYEEVLMWVDTDDAWLYAPRTLLLGKDAAWAPGEAASLDAGSAPAGSPFRYWYLLGILLLTVTALSGLWLRRQRT